MKIDFIIKGFSDALHLPDDHGFTNSELEAMKQARYDKWKLFIDTPAIAQEEEAVNEPVQE